MKWGDFVITTKRQDKSRAISSIPVGTRCVVIEVVDLPAYDLLVSPEGYVLKDDDGINDHRTVYLFRGSWRKEIIKPC